MADDDAETRAVVLARTLQRRMIRTALGLQESAGRAAELCEQRMQQHPESSDAEDWDERAKYWRLAAQRALEVARDWEAGPPVADKRLRTDAAPAQAAAADAASQLADTVVAALLTTEVRLQTLMTTSPDTAALRLQQVVDEIDLSIQQIRQIIAGLTDQTP